MKVEMMGIKFEFNAREFERSIKREMGDAIREVGSRNLANATQEINAQALGGTQAQALTILQTVTKKYGITLDSDATRDLASALASGDRVNLVASDEPVKWTK